MTGGLDKQNKALADVWILDIKRGNWRKVRLNFILCVVVYIDEVFLFCRRVLHRRLAGVTLSQLSVLVQDSQR